MSFRTNVRNLTEEPVTFRRQLLAYDEFIICHYARLSKKLYGFDLFFILGLHNKNR